MYVLFLTREQYERIREIVGESLVERIELRNIGETIEQNPLDICQDGECPVCGQWYGTNGPKRIVCLRCRGRNVVVPLT
jgi:hypothetical protein